MRTEGIDLRYRVLYRFSVICAVNELHCLYCETINVPEIIKNAGLPKLATQGPDRDNKRRKQ